MVEGMVVAVPNGVKADGALAAAAAKADSPKSVLEDEVIIWPSRFVCSVCRSFPKFFFIFWAVYSTDWFIFWVAKSEKF